MDQLTITRQQARRFLLAHQSLWPPRTLSGKDGVLAHIRRVGSIQFDPLNIVGHNPELVLQARVADLRPAMLRELLYEDRALVDGWDKMMSIYAVEDWPFFHRRREAALRHPGKSPEAVRAILPTVRQALEERGPLSSIDLDIDSVVDWSWAPTRLARAALESMHAWGETVIHHRVHTRKVYDLARRHVSAEILSAPDPNATEEQFHDWRVLRRIGSVGLLSARSGDAWLDMRGIKSAQRRAASARLLAREQLCEVHVDGMPQPLYMRTRDRQTMERACAETTEPPHAAILAPLDNLLWDRRYIEELFDFRYRWEVYKPAAERRYGYYVLPVLYGDRFIARFEPVRDKESGALCIANWWWERDVAPSPHMVAALCEAFGCFLAYLDAPGLRIASDAHARDTLDWLTT